MWLSSGARLLPDTEYLDHTDAPLAPSAVLCNTPDLWPAISDGTMIFPESTEFPPGRSGKYRPVFPGSAAKMDAGDVRTSRHSYQESSAGSPNDSASEDFIGCKLSLHLSDAMCRKKPQDGWSRQNGDESWVKDSPGGPETDSRPFLRRILAMARPAFYLT